MSEGPEEPRSALAVELQELALRVGWVVGLLVAGFAVAWLWYSVVGPTPVTTLVAAVLLATLLEVCSVQLSPRRRREPAGNRLPGVLFFLTVAAVAAMDSRVAYWIWAAWLVLWLVVHHAVRRQQGWSDLGHRMAIATALGVVGLFGGMAISWGEFEWSRGRRGVIAGAPESVLCAEFLAPVEPGALPPAATGGAQPCDTSTPWSRAAAFCRPVALVARDYAEKWRSPFLGGHCFENFLQFAGLAFVLSLFLPRSWLPSAHQLTRWLVLPAWWVGIGHITVVFPT